MLTFERYKIIKITRAFFATDNMLDLEKKKNNYSKN